MNKRDLDLLGKVFAKEIDPEFGHLPFQTKSKKYEKLRDEGYVEWVSVVLPGRFRVTVSGWQLTHLGRMTYCKHCAETVPPEEFV